MTVSFELNGQEFLALNGGPQFTFSEAVSFQVLCKDQDEVDHFWASSVKAGSTARAGG
jgi:predicted 3-demethylubiquinone-9 3-methyltransferase (glyoxalase superfamily)